MIKIKLYSWDVQRYPMAAIGQFNTFLAKLYEALESVGVYDIMSFSFDEVIAHLDKLKEKAYQPLTRAHLDKLEEMAYQPLTPPLYGVKVYYPISAPDHNLPLQPVEYASSNPIRPVDLYNSITAVYATPLNQANLDAYFSSPEGEYYRGLYTPREGLGNLGDILNAGYLSLEPHEDGYELQVDFQ